MLLADSIRSTVVSLVPPFDGIPMRLPTRSCGVLIGLALSETIASGERRPVNATDWIGAPSLAMASTDSSHPTHDRSAVPLSTAWIAGAEPRAVLTLTSRPSFFQ
jgi:hypothetical protein